MEQRAYNAQDVRRVASGFPLSLTRMADNRRFGARDEASLDEALKAAFDGGNTCVTLSYGY